MIAVGAILITVSLRSYIHYQARLEQAEVAYDVQTLFSALNDYYHATPCSEVGDVHGTFPTVGSDVYSTLISGGYLKLSALKHPANLVTSFTAEVIDTGQVSTQVEKPIYTFQITATMAPNLTDTQVTQFANQWHAKKVDATHLSWSVLPNHAMHFKSGDAFSALEGSRKLFKQQEDFISTAQGHADESCLN